MKKLLFTRKQENRHWVGDGFHVRSIFSYNDIAKEISPFLLMDYAEPEEFKPSNRRRGVGEHPHRGFETVTIVYSGQVEHRDSAGGGGLIGPGDVQWMTAAGGLVHDEFHGEEFSKNGGTFEMIQLWVNLPAKDKMSKPRYQGLLAKDIPVVELANGAGSLRVIAGEFAGKSGPGKTFSPIHLWDLRLNANKTAQLALPQGHTSLVFALTGPVKLGSGESIGPSELAVLSREESDFTLSAQADAKILILGGEPIHEPVVGYGPFVMNSMKEIAQAIEDFNNGKLGQL